MRVSEGELRKRLLAGWARRRPLWGEGRTSGFRWINRDGDGLSQVAVDWLAGLAVVSLYETLTPGEEEALVEAIAEVGRPLSVYLKRRPREAKRPASTCREQVAPSHPVWGTELHEHRVVENGLSFLVRPGQGLSFGLYFDARDARAWLQEVAPDSRVLNCFSYTCAFGVAAVAGGSRRVVNVDLSRKVLDWGRSNARLNGQDADASEYLTGDVFDWLRRFRRRGQSFDRVVLDPPSHSTASGRVFRVADDYPALVEAAAAVVSPGGLLLCAANQVTLGRSEFERRLFAGLHRLGRRGRVTARLGASSVDFPCSPGQRPALKVVILELH